MRKTTTFRLNQSGLLLALIGAAFVSQVQAAAGRVEFTIGGATLSSASGQQRTLTKGTEVNSGDVLRTTDGRVQVRMADGAYISLQPNTEFGIKNYRYEGKTDGSENAFYSLLKGAMRTVTGLIGRVNRDRYQVATPTATVGIRGTGGVIQVLDDGSTLVQGTSGIWFLSNPSGSIDVPAGVSGLSPNDPNKPPEETGEAPVAGPAPLPPEQGYVQGDQTNPDGTTVITGSILQSGDGYMAELAYSQQCDGWCPNMWPASGFATFNGAGQLVQLDDSGSVYSLGSGGSHAEFGTDGIIAWGRWIGPVNLPSGGSEDFGQNQGFHYVVGMPTTDMPKVGSATYTMIGATSPTAADGSMTPGTFSGTLSVSDWAARQITIDMNLTISMPADGLGYNINGPGVVSGNTFAGSFDNTAKTLAGTTTSSCTNGCVATVNGFFAGSAAERAGLTYNLRDFTLPSYEQTIMGAAAFKKQ